MLDNSNLDASNSVYQKNWAEEGGVIFAIQDSSFLFFNVTILDNTATDSSVLYAMSNIDKDALNIVNSVVQ